MLAKRGGSRQGKGEAHLDKLRRKMDIRGKGKFLG